MRIAKGLAGVALLAGVLASEASATSYDERSAGARALYTSLAVVGNVVPLVPTFYAPRCLPGYVICKLMFAGTSVVAAGGQLFLSGGADIPQTKAILYRGFAGDWFLTGRHTSGELTPRLLPDPPPPPRDESSYDPPPR
jgi:hypothetical protein